MESLLTLKEVAELLKGSTSTIRRFVHNLGLPCHRIGGRLLFDKTEVLDWLKTKKIENQITKRLTKFSPLYIEEEKGDKSELARKKPACFNYGFGRIYQRVYKSGRHSWTISYYDEDGKRIQKAAPQAQTKEEAAAVLHKKVAEVFDRREGIEHRRKAIGFRAFAEIFLEDYMITVRRNFRPDVYRLHMLCDYFKDMDLRNFSPLVIERFRASRLKAGNTKSTCNRYLQLLKRMFSVAVEEGYAEENPVKKVKLYSEKDNLKERILTEAEEGKLMETCSDTLRPILVVALNTGMRKTEILSLKWSQVDFKARTIRVERTKSGRVRFVPVNDALFNELTTLRIVNDKSSLVFPNPETGKPYLDMKTGFKGACRRAGISNLRFHDLRHTFASRLIEFGADIATVQRLLGHHSITVSQRYIHSGDERTKAAVELLSSRDESKICDVSVTQGNQSKLIH